MMKTKKRIVISRGQVSGFADDISFVGQKSRYRSYLKAVAFAYVGLPGNYALAATSPSGLLMAYEGCLNEISIAFLMASIVFSFFSVYRLIRFQRCCSYMLVSLVFITLAIELEKISNAMFSTVPIPNFYFGVAITVFISIIISIFMILQERPVFKNSSD